MQSPRLVPAQETVIIVHLDTARAEVVGEVGAALLRFAVDGWRRRIKNIKSDWYALGCRNQEIEGVIQQSD